MNPTMAVAVSRSRLPAYHPNLARVEEQTWGVEAQLANHKIDSCCHVDSQQRHRHIKIIHGSPADAYPD